MTDWSLGSGVGCRVCGWATLPGLALCVGCADLREWSRVNRLFCDLLHRGADLPPGDGEAVEVLAGP